MYFHFLEPLSWAILVFLGFRTFLPFLTPDRTLWRVVVYGIVWIVCFRYLWWRIEFTVIDADINTLSGFWVWFCFSIEMIGWIENFLFTMMIVRTVNRSKEADMYEAELRAVPVDHLPTVDIYIPTYNESLDILERTILGAMHVEWPKDKRKIYVLDDGRREWLKEYCAKKGVEYITRADNVGAKAGNINHALPLTHGDLVAFLDADFIPHTNFLYRTIGFFFDPKIAIVQTPHTFFNRDFVQTNLGFYKHLPDDQRLFYDIIMPSRDAWDSAFYCGTSAVGRRKLLIHHGSLSFDSITEDILLSIKLLTKGYVTRYLNEGLSHGLATESIDGYTIQRQRWARGGVQLLYAHHGIFHPGLKLLHRLFFLPLHWVIHPIMRLMILIVPIVFLLFDAPPFLVGSYVDIMRFQVPIFVATFAAIMWLAPWRWVPVITTAYENVSAINLLPTILHAIVKPYGVAFKVTPKGKDANKVKMYHKTTTVVTSILLFLTCFGIAINMTSQYHVVAQSSFYPVSVVWSFFNIIILLVMLMMSVERPRYRADERFEVKEDADIRETLNHKHVKGTMLDISTSGAQFHVPNYSDVKEGDKILVSFENFPDYPSTIVHRNGDYIHVKFDHPHEEIRDKLIVHIFTGRYRNDVHTGTTDTFFRALFHRVFKNHDHLKKHY